MLALNLQDQNVDLKSWGCEHLLGFAFRWFLLSVLLPECFHTLREISVRA